ncbi:hypothetical protein KACHI17_10630 [Sediminibacterium sp. KACHI17]|uniref:peptidylprolyl isomerase n=1 Tax=Sediminibacterium sp. KACHI17 TaxID=1751071 RepID=A0AAT9GHX1_9BACT
MRNIFFLCLFLGISSSVLAQSKHTIPVHTAYLLPATEEEPFISENGKQVYQWSDAKQSISFFFYHTKPGTLMLSLNGAAVKINQQIQVTVGGKLFNVLVPVSTRSKEIRIGSLPVTDSGFMEVVISAKKLVSKGIKIESLIVAGNGAEALRYNAKPRRNAASVHLRYPLADSIRAIGFYNEVTVPKGYDPVHSFYMANGFSRGYFGIQVNSEKERRVIFSVWDAGNEAIDRNKVAEENKVKLLAKGDGVITNDFGNEGTGGHSHWVYDWKTGETYQFMLTALPDSASQTTIYTGYFFVPELKRWKLIAAFRAPKDGKRLSNLYSFNENFVGSNGHLQRRALFGNQWVQQQNGRWVPLTEAIFSTDATGKAGDRFDIGAGVANEQFYLWNGGFMAQEGKPGDSFKRNNTSKAPTIDYTKDADSLAQAKKDIEEIATAVQAGKIDTTGSIESVYYHILQQGTGDFVSVTDTVTVHYKGSLLTDGSIFDQTRDNPATFPLRRLIRGWQLALPKCRVGGKVRVIIPSAQAYGIRTRSKDIPPNKVLVFDIEVISTKRQQ